MAITSWVDGLILTLGFGGKCAVPGEENTRLKSFRITRSTETHTQTSTHTNYSVTPYEGAHGGAARHTVLNSSHQ